MEYILGTYNICVYIIYVNKRSRKEYKLNENKKMEGLLL